MPPFAQYLRIAPFIGLLVPIAFQVQGLYRLRRGRSRVDDFFGVFVGSILAVVLGLGGTLYVPDLLRRRNPRRTSALYEVSQGVWVLFLVLNVAFTYASRELVREALERRWRAGIGLKRVLIAGAGDLGRMVADKVLEHRELGFKVVGFLDDRAGGDHIGYRGLPLLGTLAEADDIIRREHVDHLYVALPLEEHVKMLGLVEATNREGVDVHVVPDLLQFIALRARLENLDGVPIISLNDVPLRGLQQRAEARHRRRDLGGGARRLSRFRSASSRCSIKRELAGAGVLHAGAHGARRQGVRRLQVPIDVRGRRGRHRPGLGARRRPARTPRRPLAAPLRPRRAAAALERAAGATCRSSARGRSVRYFVEQFKHRIPQYMLRHKVKAGITGWAQVNGWRGNTSLEKRIEYDLYYIENWSVALDLKIMWLTLVRGFHGHAF